MVKINVNSGFSSECDNCFYAYDWLRKEVINLKKIVSLYKNCIY